MCRGSSLLHCSDSVWRLKHVAARMDQSTMGSLHSAERKAHVLELWYREQCYHGLQIPPSPHSISRPTTDVFFSNAQALSERPSASTAILV